MKMKDMAGERQTVEARGSQTTAHTWDYARPRAEHREEPQRGSETLTPWQEQTKSGQQKEV